MEENNEIERKLNIERIIGIIFLIPPIIGVFIFIINVFFWIKYNFYGNSASIFPLPQYFLGFMAIVGVYLIKGTSKN